LVQIKGAEEDKECYDGRVNIYGARNIDRSKKSSIYDVKKRLSNGNKVKTQRRNSTSTILRILRHQNIDLSDLFEDKDGTQPGATGLLSVSLDSLIHCSRRLSFAEADYYFKQVVSGVEYLYTAGIAHRDLNPDNLILTSDGTLKITNFSQAESFFYSRKSKSKVKLSSKKCGSLPYIAPEVLVEQHFDPRPVDMWALAIVYMEMRTGKLLWNFAAEGGDEYYDRYLRDRSGLWGYRPVENLENVSWCICGVVESY
jgi:protein-serine/threonine kinase